MDTEQLLEAAKTISIISSLFQDKPNEWLPVVAAVGGAFVGGIFGVIPTFLSDKRKERRDRRSLTCALLSEIESIVEIIERRKYVEAIEAAIDDLKGGRAKLVKLTFTISPDYARIYNSCHDRIGVLDRDVATRVIKFHHLIESIILDVSANSHAAINGGGLEIYEELNQIFSEALNVAKCLTKSGV
jgi:hypothetical protein